jgi:hypothetical protein
VVLGESYGGNEHEDVKVIGVDGSSAGDIAGEEAGSATTVYFLPDGRVKRGDELAEDALATLPRKTMALVGYVCGGYITAKRSAFDICGKRWNFPSTFYRFSDGTVRPGHTLDEQAIPRNTQVFFRK